MGKKKQKAEKKKEIANDIDEDKLFSDVSKLAEGILDLAKSVVPFYKDFADDVIYERITDINQIERQLDYMLDFCFYEEILLLYKAVLRKLYYNYPETVVSYVQFYREMYEDEGEEDEQVSEDV